MTPSTRKKLLRRSGITLFGLVGVAVAGLLSSTGCLSSFGARPDPSRMGRLAKASKFTDGEFQNVIPPENQGPGFKTLMEFFFSQDQRVPPAPLPLVDPRSAWLTPPASGLRVTWLGHSTLLLELDGRRVLTDPVWGDRASPSTVVGPHRFHPPVISMDELPELDAVVISHDHYDHLDMGSIRALAEKGARFYVPLGVAAHLALWGVPAEQLEELDWWEERVLPGKDGSATLTLVATPARHFSGRGLSDRNATLWTSWVARTDRHRVYFSGDTGLTPQFDEIRERQGPFDLVMLEVGAFHPSWGDIHLGPDNALKALAMLGGGPFLPIHWGTFNLGLHAWDEPARRLAQLARERGIALLTPRIGTPLEVRAPPPLDAWWREVREDGVSALDEVPTF